MSQIGGSKLHLGSGQSRRRVGLARRNHVFAPLHEISNASRSRASSSIPPLKAATNDEKFKMPEQEDEDEDEDEINRSPESSDVEDISADMVKTQWDNVPEDNKKLVIVPSIPQPPPNASRGRQPAASKYATRIRIPTKNRTPASSQVSTASSSSSKRKSVTEEPEIGAGHKQAVGFTWQSKMKRCKTKVTYSSSQKNAMSFQPACSQDSKKAQKSKPTGIGSFKKFDDVSDEEDFLIPNPKKPAGVTTNESKRTVINTFKNAPPLNEDSEDELEIQGLKPYIPPFVDSSPQKPRLEALQGSIKLPNLQSSPALKSDLEPTSFEDNFASYTMRDTNRPIRDKKALLDKFGFGAVASLVIEDTPNDYLTVEEEFPLIEKVGYCPMCGKSVNLDTLKRCGQMNTRKQLAFCRSHQKETAEKEWHARGYPKIDWDKLYFRISEHYSFLEQLVNGNDCHYRHLLDESVKAGKDRNLLKSTSNITPGYYGSRGLRVISESIMHIFTPLLKKRAVADKLMSARGVTGFVQSVLVPEVTVLLIMEDMTVDKARARDILKESVGMGELIHEEIRDILIRDMVGTDEDYY